MSRRHVWVNGRRHYDCDEGRIFPGVTTVLEATKPADARAALERWRNRVGRDEANKISREAAERGSAVHKAAEDYFAGRPVEVAPDYTPHWLSLRSALAESALKPAYLETFVWAEFGAHGYAGTLDFLGEYRGRPAIVDFKTSSKPKREDWIGDYFLQLAAYAGAATKLGYATPPVELGVVIVALADAPAQEFVLNLAELRERWKDWRLRLAEFYAGARQC